MIFLVGHWQAQGSSLPARLADQVSLRLELFFKRRYLSSPDLDARQAIGHRLRVKDRGSGAIAFETV
jgi:hypothetical protein